jgi:Zn-finger nucleic acid-binding protein
MEAVTLQDITVQRCTGCKGLWFQAADHESLKQSAQALDTGDASVGAQHDAATRVMCPACQNSPLFRMVDAAQPHIHFESCGVCHGRYYDAGEFRDFAEHDLGEFLRNFFAPARG